MLDNQEIEDHGLEEVIRRRRARALRDMIELEMYYPTHLLGELWYIDETLLELMERFFARVNQNRVTGAAPGTGSRGAK